MRRAALLAAALLLTGCASAAPASTEDRVAVSHRLPAGCPDGLARSAAGEKVLPELSFPCLAGGSDFSLARAPGVPSVLNLWAPWCAPCRDELPLFQRLYVEAPEQVRTVGLVEMDTVTSALAYTDEHELTFPSAVDQTGKLLSDQGLNGLPVTYFLDAGGGVVYTHIGPITSYDDLRALLAEHLGVTLP